MGNFFNIMGRERPFFFFFRNKTVLLEEQAKYNMGGGFLLVCFFKLSYVLF